MSGLGTALIMRRHSLKGVCVCACTLNTVKYAFVSLKL